MRARVDILQHEAGRLLILNTPQARALVRVLEQAGARACQLRSTICLQQRSEPASEPAMEPACTIDIPTGTRPPVTGAGAGTGMWVQEYA